MFNNGNLLEQEAVSLAIFHDKYIDKHYVIPVMQRALERLGWGINYLIVDADGYTVDISLNRILKDNNIE